MMRERERERERESERGRERERDKSKSKYYTGKVIKDFRVQTSKTNALCHGPRQANFFHMWVGLEQLI